MNNIISNSYMPKFTGLRYNTSLKKAKEYANSTNQNEIFKKARELVDNLSGDNLKITVRKK